MTIFRILKKLKKPFLIIFAIALGLVLFSQTTVGKRLLLPAGSIEAVRNFFAGNPELHACDYKNGEIILIKPVATGDGDGRWEAGDIVNIRETDEICQRLGDIDFLGKREKTDFLVVYYPAKLTEEQKRNLIEPEYATSTDQTREIPQEMIKRRQAGVDYTKFLTNSEILKIRSLESLNKIPEIDLSSVIQKNPEQKSVVKLPEYLARVENFKKSVSKIVRKVIPFARAASGTFTICPTGQGCDYITLSAWEAAQESNLTGTGPCIAQIQGDWTGVTDTTAVIIGTGWTTTAADYIRIYTTTAARHTGKWDTTKYRLDISSLVFTAIDVEESFVRIDGLQIRVSGAGAPSYNEVLYFHSESAGTGVFYVSNNILKNDGSSQNRIGLECDRGGTVYVYNNVIQISGGTVRSAGIRPYAATWNIFNNTIYGTINASSMTGGINGASNITRNITNNAVFNNYDDFNFLAGTNNLDYNASDDGDGTHAIDWDDTSTTWNANFVDYANTDVHIKNVNSSLFNAGMIDPGSGLYSNDFEGDTRLRYVSWATNAWDIGADEYSGADLRIRGDIKIRGDVKFK